MEQRPQCAIGETVQLNGKPFTIIGIAPEGFNGTMTGLRAELFAPATMAPVLMPGVDITIRHNRSYMVIGRLARGVSLEAARSGLAVLARRLQRSYPD